MKPVARSAHPGYLGSQDTFYVGTLVGRVYQQTYVDTYCHMPSAKPADLLNDRVLPFHEEHDLPVLRI